MLSFKENQFTFHLVVHVYVIYTALYLYKKNMQNLHQGHRVTLIK